jgi:hypothetical protein
VKVDSIRAAGPHLLEARVERRSDVLDGHARLPVFSPDPSGLSVSPFSFL